MNRRKLKTFSSKYKGVFFDKKSQKWRTMITIDNKQKTVGFFSEEIDAVIAYNKKAKELFGEFAYINII